MRRAFTGFVAGVMIVTGAVQSMPIAMAATTAVKPAAIPSLKSIPFGIKSYFKVNTIQLIPASGNNTGKTLYFTVTVHNGGSSDLSFLDYWVKVRTLSGGVIKAKQLENEKSKNYIAPGSDGTFSFYASVSNATTIESLKFSFIKFDFSAPNYERVIGTITVPKGYSSSVQLNSLATIYIGGESLKLRAVKLMKQFSLGYNYFTAKLRIVNSGRKTLTIPAEYKYYIRTANNLMYPLYLDKSVTAITVDAQDTLDIDLSAKIPANISLTKSEIVVVQEAGLGESGKMELPISSLLLPTSSVDAVAQIGLEQPYNLQIDKIPASLTITELSSEEIEDASELSNVKRNVSLKMLWANKGNDSITLPEYSYVLKTKDNISYTMTAAASQPPGQGAAATDTKVISRGTLELELTTPIADEVDLNGATLILYKKVTYGVEGQATDIQIPIAKFVLPDVNTPPTTEYGSPGIPAIYETDTAKYEVVVDHIYRLPWADDDQISASIQLTNKGTTTAPVLDLLVGVKLDGYEIKADQIRVIKDSSALNLLPGESATIHLIANVPYVQKIERFEFDLKQKDGEKTNDIVQVAETMANVQAVPPSENPEWQISQSGKSYTARIVSKKLFAGTTNQAAQIQLELSNSSTRYSVPTVLTGWLVTKDGYYFRLDALKLDETISPSGKALVSLQGVVPNGIDLAGAQAIVGEAVTGATWSTDPTAADGVIEPEAIALDGIPGTTVQSSFNSIVAQSYTLTMDKLKLDAPNGSLANGIVLEYRSNLRRTGTLYEAATQQPELYFELETWGQKYGTSVRLGEGTGGQKILPLGEETGTISFTTTDVGSVISGFFDGTVNVYEVIQLPNGQTYKNKLASQSVKWFTES